MNKLFNYVSLFCLMLAPPAFGNELFLKYQEVKSALISGEMIVDCKSLYKIEKSWGRMKMYEMVSGNWRERKGVQFNDENIILSNGSRNLELSDLGEIWTMIFAERLLYSKDDVEPFKDLPFEQKEIYYSKLRESPDAYLKFTNPIEDKSVLNLMKQRLSKTLVPNLLDVKFKVLKSDNPERMEAGFSYRLDDIELNTIGSKSCKLIS